MDTELEAPGAEVAPLFAWHPTLRAIVEAGVERRQGTIARDEGAARLSLGCYHVFGGDPASPGARRLIESAEGPRELIYGNDPTWRALILEVLGDRVFDRPMDEFDPSCLDDSALATVEASLAPDFSLRPLDEDLAAQLDRELEPHGLQVFASPRDLAAEGLGVGIVSGDRLACAATSYTRSSHYVEVAIATRPDYRGRGLAAVAAAAFLRECLRRNLEPCWSASNPVSKRLALRLGYRPGSECEVLYLRG